MVNVVRSVPVMFEKVDQVDTRFQKVKIWLMHLGQNYNNSIFTKEVVEEAMSSLKNTPILGYIEESNLGEKDFRGHEIEVVVEGGEFKTKYIGQAFGVIPENCNPRFETKKGDFNNDLEYLVVDGLMWTKFDDGVNILNTHGEVSQSMELHEDYDGYFNEDDVFVFTNFSFYGACLLGKDVLPAMQKASVEVSFASNVSVYQEEIERKIKEFQIAIRKRQSKEVEKQMSLTEVIAIATKYSVTVEQMVERGVNIDDFTNVSDLEEKIIEVFDVDLNKEDDNTETKMSNENEDEAKEFTEDEDKDKNDDEHEKFTLNFDLSHDDIRRSLYDGLNSHIANSIEDAGEDSWNYIVSVFDSYFVAENERGQTFYKVEYSREDDNITLGKVDKVYAMFLTGEEKGALELMRKNFDQYKQENEELKAFKISVEESQHEQQAEELFAKFDKLTDEEITDLRENVHSYTIDQIETKCYELVGRKLAKFSQNKTQQSYSVKIGVNPSKTEEKSDFRNIFKKHGFNPKMN